MLWPDFISYLLEEPFQISVTYFNSFSLTYDIFELLIKIKTLKYKLEVHRSGNCSLGTFELYKS